jgi:hypothetical protein
MAHDFEELALDEYNYPTWALDVKISLAFHGILPALSPHVERGGISGYIQVPSIIHIRNHLHHDLKSEYVMEEGPHSLWVALKGRYKQ